MSPFASALRELSDRLSLPQPARARVLMEVAGDLEALRQALVDRGLSPEEAEDQALERIDLSDDAVRSLVQVHGGWFRRVTDSIGERAGSRWEAVLLTALILVGLLLSGSVLHAIPLAREAGASLAPVALAAAVAFGIGAWKAYVLWIRADHRPRGLHDGLGPLLGAVVLQLFLAFAALGFTALTTVHAIRVAPEAAGPTTFHWLLEALATLTMSLSLALSGGLVWFVLLGKVAAIERSEAETLLPEGVR